MSGLGSVSVLSMRAAFGLALLCSVGCGPRPGTGDGEEASDDSSGSLTSAASMTTTSATSLSATGTPTTADDTMGDTTTAADGCGDGVPESGVFCLERIEMPEVEGPIRLGSVDADRDGLDELAVFPNTGGRCRSSEGLCLIDWDEPAGSILAMNDTPATECGVLRLRVQANSDPQFAACIGEGIGTYLLSGEELEVESQMSLPEGPYYTPRPFAAIDVDDDGRDEILAQDIIEIDGTWDTPLLLRLEGDAWTYSGEPLPFGGNNAHRYPAAVGDLDGDGRTEVVLEDNQHYIAGGATHANYDPAYHQLVVLRSDTGLLLEHARFPAGTWPMTVQLADLDLDGRLDLVVRGADRVGLALGLGDGTFTDVELLEIVGYDLDGDWDLVGARVADLDGDGDPELALAVSPGYPTHGDLLIIDDPLGSAVQTTIATATVEGSRETDDEFVAKDFTGDTIAEVAVTTNVDGEHRLSLFVARP